MVCVKLVKLRIVRLQMSGLLRGLGAVVLRAFHRHQNLSVVKALTGLALVAPDALPVV